MSLIAERSASVANRIWGEDMDGNGNPLPQPDANVAALHTGDAVAVTFKGGKRSRQGSNLQPSASEKTGAWAAVDLACPFPALLAWFRGLGHLFKPCCPFEPTFLKPF